MLTRRPAARGEPASEAVRQQRSRFERREGQGIGRRHREEVSRQGGFVEGLRRPLAPLFAGRGWIAGRSGRGAFSASALVTACAERAPHPTPLPAKSAARKTDAAVRPRLLRYGLFGNLPVLAVEDRDVERLHRRV